LRSGRPQADDCVPASRSVAPRQSGHPAATGRVGRRPREGADLRYATRCPAGAVLRLALVSLLLIGGAIAAVSGAPEPEGSPAFEYQVKVGFLFNFAKFVEWPPQAFSGPGAPLTIGVLGDDSFCDALEQGLRGKTVNSRPIEIRRLRRADLGSPVHILFIGASLGRDVASILGTLRKLPVLTVAHMDRFALLGGIINFTIESHKLRFEINRDAAERAGLRISSQLLAIATIVRDTPQEGR